MLFWLDRYHCDLSGYEKILHWLRQLNVQVTIARTEDALAQLLMLKFGRLVR